MVVVSDHQLSVAIGKRGQNVRLAMKLTGWDIDIISETEYEKMRSKETEPAVEEALKEGDDIKEDQASGDEKI